MNKTLLRQVMLYGIIGATSAGLDFFVFYLLNSILHINEFLANAISIHCGIFLSFVLNSRYNFKKTDKFLMRFLSFYATGLAGLALSSGILYLGNLMALSVTLSKLFSVFFVAAVQFTINKLITFRR